MTFIDGKGRDKVFTYRNARKRPPATLREVLGCWKMLVIDGILSVDGQGVVEGMEYFDNIEDSGFIAVEGKEVEVVEPCGMLRLPSDRDEHLPCA